ncbi:hypothetical protein GGH12_002455 [Coemansia sp. RSA 1822]|nr:hypothetical protein GGH12_002455 [Coemansia sp. RSA 1822]
MGILQKDRHGARALKPPIPVPEIWEQRIKQDEETDDDTTSAQETQLMQTLRSQALDLATRVDLTWLEQSKLLKHIGESLSSLKRLSEVSLATLGYLRQVAIPMFVECYFMPSDIAVRRQVIPILKSLSALDPSCIDNVLQANLLAFIGAREQYHELEMFHAADATIAAEVYGRQLVSQRALALEVLASVPQGFPVIRRFVSDVLAYAASALDASLPQLCEPRQDIGSVELVGLREDCTQIMRLVFMCVSKLIAEDVGGTHGPAIAGDLQSAILASMRAPSPGFVEQTLARVYALCWELVGSDNAALKSRQVAAMVMVALIEGSGLSRQQRAVALAVRALDIKIHNLDTSSEPAESYLPPLVSSTNRKHCMDDAVSMICIARAIVSLASYETTLVALDIEPSIRIPSICNNVHEAVFTHIASICGRSQLAPGVKIIVFESMAIWLQETAKLLARCLGEVQRGEERDMHAMAFALGQRVLILQRERIMGYLWSYWDDPIDAVQVKVRTIFEAFLDIGSTMNQAIIANPVIAESALTHTDSAGQSKAASPGAQDGNAFLSDVLDLVLTMDWSRKVKYSLLAALCARINVLGMLTGHSDILTSCLETMAQVTMASRAGQLLTALLSRAADDIRCAREQAPEGEEEAEALRVETEHMALWKEPVTAALCRDDDTSRRMLTQQLLPALFEALPRIVSEILKALTELEHAGTGVSTLGHAERARQQQTLDACRQHALIVVLKVARSLDIITIDRVVRMDTAGSSMTSSVLEMLNQAVYHPDWTVRGDMLGLLCESRKLFTPLDAVESELLFKLLRVSANAPSADFRQQQQGALTTLASRLVTVATHSDRVVATGRPPVPSQKLRHRERARRADAVARGKAEGKSEEQVLRELGVLSQAEMVAQAKVELENVEVAVTRWLDLAVRGCLYPGAGFAKVAMGLRWLGILTSFFTPGRPAQSPESSMVPFEVAALGAPNFGRGQLPARGSGVTADEIVTVLTQVLIDDPFDANRAGAFELLTSWPLVRAEDGGAAQRWAAQLLGRALHLIGSTRAGESESGALIIRWLFRKFVVLQGVRLDIDSDDKHVDAANMDVPCDVQFARGLLARIARCRMAAESNLLDAAQHSPLHGLLTAVQYVVAEIDFASSEVQAYAELWRAWLAALAQESIDVTRVVLSVLTSASPEGNIPASYREMEDTIDGIIRAAGAIEISDAASDVSSDDEGGAGNEPAGPRQQVILSYCWRAVKEVSGVLAVVATCPPGSDQSDETQSALIDSELVSRIGGLLHTLLTSIRHRGAFSAVHPAFARVCGRMFSSADVELNRRVSEWLDQCVDIATICRVSVTRRSAGWPLCLLATLTCDKLATQALLPRAMDKLFALASDLQTDSEADKAVASDSEAASNADDTTDLPQVHAINMMRTLLEDHTLASDIVPYVEHAFVVALTGLRSRRWAIRNVCSLLFAALARRVFGNSRGREETKYDGITGRELFTRFPGLHPFLTRQLEDAVDRLAEIDMVEDPVEITDDEGQGEQTTATPPLIDPASAVLRTGARFIHPALYPCLILLARLQPTLADATVTRDDSAGNADAEAGVVAEAPHAESATSAVAPPMNLDREPLTRVNERNSTVHVTSASTMLSMYSFTELVELCVDSPVFKTREMAARAFAPLVPSERAASVVTSLLKGVHDVGATIAANSCHGTLCQVHELLRVHWRHDCDAGMRRAFVMHVFPALTALWPILVQAVDKGVTEDTAGEHFDVTDVVRHRYLVLVNEFVARGEAWLLPGLGDLALARTTRVLLTRFRLTMLYGTLHPVLTGSHVLTQSNGAQVAGAYGTVEELVRLFLACVDDDALTVVRDDGSVQLRIGSDVVDEHGSRMAADDDVSSEVLYSPWPVLGSVLANNSFYEAKLLVLEWMLDHASHERMHIFERIGIDSLLPRLIADSQIANDECSDLMLQPSRDPCVRAAAIRLLAQLCTRLEIDARTLPVRDMVTYWDAIAGQLSGSVFCPLPVATALVELQAALVHLLLQYPASEDSVAISDVNQRTFAWAQQIYEWTDPERAAPYRLAVSRALVTYSAIKRYIEAGRTSPRQRPSAPVDAPSEEIMRLCYWRLLQDDDEEIREYMARSISRRLGRELSCDQACEKLVLDFRPPSNYGYPHTYVRNRLRYIYGVDRSVKQAVSDAISPGCALFAHENPNIYIDEPRNVQLAYHSLVTIADIYAGTEDSVRELTLEAARCVEALGEARGVLVESRKLMLENGVVLNGVLGVTSVSALFSLLQSWILGARLTVFAATRVGDCSHLVDRVIEVATSWAESEELQPLHPWIARAMRQLGETAVRAKEASSMDYDEAVSDLFLLTCVE